FRKPTEVFGYGFRARPVGPSRNDESKLRELCPLRPPAPAGIGGVDFGTLLAPLVAAFVAPAALRLDVGVEVVLAVVVGDLVARLDVPDRLDPDAARAGHRIGVRPAGMVDVARQVRARRAVDGPARIHLEPVAIVGALVALLVGQQRAGVLDDVFVLADRLGREHAKPGARARDAERTRAVELRLVFLGCLAGGHSGGACDSGLSTSARQRVWSTHANQCAARLHSFNGARDYCLGT